MSPCARYGSLKNATEKYWKKLRRNHDDPLPTQREYVRELLPQEMEGKEAPQPCKTLVLLVGHSIEPLLQSVWVYRPQTLLLILNRQYGETLSGWDFAGQICTLLSELPLERQIESSKVLKCVIDEATPAQVFSVLLRKARGRPEVVIDITGAKKSMVAGAFLYAAYAHVPVSYVDFDDAMYNTEYGRPYGCASEIRAFENPYNVFALRNWERVRELYLSYHFREACRLLEEEIKPVMAALSFEPNPDIAVERLAQALRCYDLWDAGDFSASREVSQELQKQGVDFDPPTAVTLLADVWPHVEQGTVPRQAADDLSSEHKALAEGDGTPANSFFCCEAWLVTYAKDELARIRRLIDSNEDYRSAFLRAASLNEVLLKARLAGLWRDGKLQAPAEKSLIPFAKLVNKATAQAMLNLLCEGQTLYMRGDLAASLQPNVSTMAAFWEEYALDLDTLITLRNKTVHTYLSIPRSLADAAWQVAGANLQDYRDDWTTTALPTVIAGVLPWRDLCLLCGADAFLPPNLLRETSYSLSSP
jgi:hypothetical protein